MKLKHVKFNRTFILPNNKGNARMAMLKGVRYKPEGHEVYVCPYEEGRMWEDRGYWVNLDIEVEIVESKEKSKPTGDN